MGDLIDWLSRQDVRIGIFVVCVLLLLWLAGYVLQRIDDSKPIRIPTILAICVCAVGAASSGYIAFLMDKPPASPSAELPAAATAPPAQPNTNSTAATASAPRAAASQRPRAIRTRSLAEGQPPQAISTNQEDECGPPFYLAWWNLNAPASPTQETSEAVSRCSGPMEENGYGREFATRAEALAAAAQANMCVGPGFPMRAALDKC